MKYGEGVPQPATQRGAKSASSVVGSAGKQASAARRPFAVFDIDGTLIRWQLYHAIADALAEQGYIEPEIYQTMKDARMAWKKRMGGSFRDYELKVIVVYEAILKKLTFEQFETAANAVFEEYKDQVYTYTRDLIAKLKEEGYLLLAISGSQTEIVEKIAGYYGFDDYVGTIYKRTDKGYDGSKMIGSHDKDKTLNELVKRHAVEFRGSIGVGDSQSDANMLELVEQPIAFNPDAGLYEIAKNNGWKIVIERKNMIYELKKQGARYELVKTSAR